MQDFKSMAACQTRADLYAVLYAVVRACRWFSSMKGAATDKGKMQGYGPNVARKLAFKRAREPASSSCSKKLLTDYEIKHLQNAVVKETLKASSTSFIYEKAAQFQNKSKILNLHTITNVIQILPYGDNPRECNHAVSKALD
uniref:Uncharacterized protein n=1 Tax=Glossina austeni TaxID=7395 RepID=A0A1A9UYR1_GLOAU